MYSLSQRINQVFNVAVLYGGVIVVLVALVSQWQLIHDNAFGLSSSIGGVSPSFNVRTSRYYGSVKGQPKENMRIEFDLDADLSPLFNWNTKQVFVYLTASYNGTEKARGHTVNTVTLGIRLLKLQRRQNCIWSTLRVSTRCGIWKTNFQVKTLLLNCNGTFNHG